MSQSRLGSVAEAMTNVVVGFLLGYTANAIFFPMVGWEITHSQNVTLGVIYTVLSLVRSFALRRLFNRLRFGHARHPSA